MQESQEEYICSEIYEESTVQEIEDLNIHALDRFSNQLRQSVYRFSVQSTQMQSYKQLEIFHKKIVNLIEKIQPSKLAMSNIFDLVSTLLQSYFQEEKNSSTFRDKNILTLNKLKIGDEKSLLTGIITNLEIVRKCLLLRESQLGNVLFVEDNLKKYSPVQFLKIYSENYKEIKDFVIPVEKCQQKINYFIITQILEKQTTFLDDFASNCKNIEKAVIQADELMQLGKSMKTQQKLFIQKSLRYLKIISSKISTIADLFPFACTKDAKDLFSYPPEHQRWQSLFKSGTITYKLYGERDKIDKSFTSLKDNLNVINAAMNIMNEANQSNSDNHMRKIPQFFETVGKVLKVTFNKEMALHQTEMMIADPKENLAKQIWNLPQRKQFKNFIELTLPSIDFSKQFFIPRLCRDFFDRKMKGEPAQLPDFSISNVEQYLKYIKVSQPNRLSIRINNYFQLQLKTSQKDQKPELNFIQKKLEEASKNMKNNLENFKKFFKGTNQPPEAVIFHIHGGGFISMSSFIHQAYTRNWANNLKVPIISVDYGKAPQYPFPEGLYDCLQAYLWTLHTMQQLYHCKPVRIVLVGDSAGGNLVAVLTSILISWKLRVPDGIVMAYPALNLNYFDYTPSLLTALNDLILPHSFLKICLKSYLKNPLYKPDECYLISPVLTPNTILKQYPPARIFVGSKDPFHDDCCRFAQKIQALKRDVQLKIMEEFPHGFLQFDMKNKPHPYCRQATKQVEHSLRDLLFPDKSGVQLLA